MATNKRVQKKIMKNLYRKGYGNLPLTKFEQKKMRKEFRVINSIISKIYKVIG